MALLLQPLIENAVKHGIAPRAAGGVVRLLAQRADHHVVLLVEDDGVGYGRSPVATGTGTGVSSCRSRIGLSYGEAGAFEIGAREGGGTRVRVELPIQGAEAVT